MGTIRLHWRLALALGLIGLQAAILGVGLWAPRVSPGYRALFIDKTLRGMPFGDHSVIWPDRVQVPEMNVPVAS